MTIDLGIAARPKKGESISGDAYFCGEWDRNALLAVVDGLGHGEQANKAAVKATSFLAHHFSQDPVTMIKGCHQELRGSRGAVIGLALIDKKSNIVSYAGIGNIEGRIIIREKHKAQLHLRSMNGIAGCNLERVQGVKYPYQPGDTIVMFSDGISSRIDLFEFLPTNNLQETADRILEKHSKDDDATILLARL